jgi:hypothetical protein
VFPRAERREDRTHVAVRFGDDHLAIIEVVVDHDDVTRQCFEAVEGVDGYVLCFVEPRHRCATCGKGVCSYRRDGVVMIGHQHKVQSRRQSPN